MFDYLYPRHQLKQDMRPAGNRALWSDLDDVAAWSETKDAVGAKRKADDHVPQEASKRSRMGDEAKRNDDNDECSGEMERIEDAELRAQIEAQLQSATPIIIIEGEEEDGEQEGGLTALHQAAKCGVGRGVIARLLAACPELIDVEAKKKGTALHFAARNGHAAIVAQLLAVKPNFDVWVNKGWTALHDAAAYGHAPIVTQLLAVKPALIDVTSKRGWTALHSAAANGQTVIVGQLLSARASVDARTDNGETVLHCAVINKHTEVVKRLLAYMPDSITARARGGRTVLHEAVGHDEITALLLAAHPSLLYSIINDKDSWGALRNVVEMGHEGAVCSLLSMHPNLIHKAAPECGWTIFHDAARHGRDKIMSRLIETVRMNQPEQLEQLLLRKSTHWWGHVNLGSTALHMAAMKGHSSIVTQLLAACPALIDVLDRDNQTCLHCAISWPHYPIVEQLLAYKPALVHTVDAKRNTILHSMTFYRGTNFGKELLQRVWKLNPAALHTVNLNGDTPFELAVAANNDTAIDLLQWSMTFDEILNAYSKSRQSCVAKFKPLMPQLVTVLLPDVAGIVFDYLVQTPDHFPLPAPPPCFKPFIF